MAIKIKILLSAMLVVVAAAIDPNPRCDEDEDFRDDASRFKDAITEVLSTLSTLSEEVALGEDTEHSPKVYGHFSRENSDEGKTCIPDAIAEIKRDCVEGRRFMSAEYEKERCAVGYKAYNDATCDGGDFPEGSDIRDYIRTVFNQLAAKPKDGGASGDATEGTVYGRYTCTTNDEYCGPCVYAVTDKLWEDCVESGLRTLKGRYAEGVCEAEYRPATSAP